MTHPSGMSGTLSRNIERLSARSGDRRRRQRWQDRLADRITGFAGSMAFVGLHLGVFGGWIAVNLGWVPGVVPFDPTFVVLAMIASVEAIFLSTFVLISQNRMQAAADLRADLDLHVNLLAEHELSRLAALVARIAERLDVSADAPDLREIQENVSPERVLDALEQRSGERG